MAVLLDTSFLISFADPSRPNHSIAVEYFRHCVANNVPMFLSAIAAAEFEVGQPVEDLPLQNFTVLPFNLPHAILAGKLVRQMHEERTADDTDARAVVINDLKLLAQAEAAGIEVMLTEDEKTLAKFARRISDSGIVKVRILLLKDGFTPGMLTDPDQTEMGFGSEGVGS